MSDYPNVRIATWAARKLLSGSTVSTRDLRETFGINEATARGVLSAVAEELGAEVRKKKPLTFALPAPTSPEVQYEIAALQLARELLGALKGSMIHDALGSVLAETCARAEAAPRDYARAFFANTRAARPDVVDSEVVDAVIDSIIRCRTLELELWTFKGNRRVAVMEPWSLVLSQDGWHVYGRCADSESDADIDNMRAFNLLRIERAKVLGDVFAYPSSAEFDPAKTFAHTLSVFPASENDQPIAVRFSLPRRWLTFLTHQKLHASQEIDEVSDRVHVSLRLVPNWDVERLLNGFGEELRRLDG